MLPRLLTALCILIPLFPVSSYAHDQALAESISEHLICEELLGDGLVFTEYEHEGKFTLDFSQGIGPRQFVGQYPGESVASTIQALQQGALWWDLSISIAKSVEEARAHDAQLDDLKKTVYLISDLDVSSFTKDTPRPILAQAFRKAFESGQLIHFSEYYAADGKRYEEYSPKHEDKYSKHHYPRYDRYLMEMVDKEKLRRMVDFNDIYFARDMRGARFKFLGWTRPVQRGIISHEEIFKLNNEGWIANKEIRSAIKRLVKFMEAGGEIVFNGNFEEALQRAVHMKRDNGEGKKEKNSRYIEDPWAIPVARELYQMGQAFSMEARMNGKLLVGQIGYIVGDIPSGDTVFFDDPDELSPDDPELARAMIMAGLMRMKAMGIPFQDVNVVTKFTGQAGGQYIPDEEFMKYVEAQKGKGPVNLRFDQPFTLAELPYPYEKRSEWLDPHGRTAK